MEGREKLLEVDGKILTQALARLIGDLAPVSQQALSTLINLSNETAIVEHMTKSSSLFDKVMENLKSYHEKLGSTKAKLQIERSVQETTKIQLRLNLICCRIYRKHLVAHYACCRRIIKTEILWA